MEKGEDIVVLGGNGGGVGDVVMGGLTMPVFLTSYLETLGANYQWP